MPNPKEVANTLGKDHPGSLAEGRWAGWCRKGEIHGAGRREGCRKKLVPAPEQLHQEEVECSSRRFLE